MTCLVEQEEEDVSGNLLNQILNRDFGDARSPSYSFHSSYVDSDSLRSEQ